VTPLFTQNPGQEQKISRQAKGHTLPPAPVYAMRMHRRPSTALHRPASAPLLHHVIPCSLSLDTCELSPGRKTHSPFNRSSCSSLRALTAGKTILWATNDNAVTNRRCGHPHVFQPPIAKFKRAAHACMIKTPGDMWERARSRHTVWEDGDRNDR
jgi:hypothetical protein